MEFISPHPQPFVKPNSRGQLPHLYKPYGTYFITPRLFDAILPRKPVAPLAPDADDIEPEDLMRDIDPPITLGSCALGQHAIATMAQDALLHFEGIRYELRAWCVMPNHAHIVFQAIDPWNPGTIMKGWKGYTARRANQLLHRHGHFWEQESFDHLIRSPRSLTKFVLYTEHNPSAAHLCAVPEDWPYSSRRHFGNRFTH